MLMRCTTGLSFEYMVLVSTVFPLLSRKCSSCPIILPLLSRTIIFSPPFDVSLHTQSGSSRSESDSETARFPAGASGESESLPRISPNQFDRETQQSRWEPSKVRRGNERASRLQQPLERSPQEW